MPNQKVAFFVTNGKKTSFFNTTGSTSIFQTGQRADAFFVTKSETNIFLTGSRQVAFFVTTGTAPILLTSSQQVAFFVTPVPQSPKDLVLRWGVLTINTPQTQMDVTDGTGTYNATTNPTGYNPESSTFDPLRPKRSALYLWTVYRIKSDKTNPDQTLGPDTQPDEAEAPYEYTLSLPVDEDGNVIKGLYELFLVGAPRTETYTPGLDYVSLATQNGWFLASAGIMVDSTVQNCINRMRYEFLQSVMCGKCNEAYLEVYGLYVGMLNAMESGEWTTAVEIYEKLKEICSSQEQSCTC